MAPSLSDTHVTCSCFHSEMDGFITITDEKLMKFFVNTSTGKISIVYRVAFE